MNAKFQQGAKDYRKGMQAAKHYIYKYGSDTAHRHASELGGSDAYYKGYCDYLKKYVKNPTIL